MGRYQLDSQLDDLLSSGSVVNHCFCCGNKLINYGAGFISCSVCGGIFLPVMTPEGNKGLICMSEKPTEH